VTGAGWTVAVIDWGVDTGHPYRAGKTNTGIDGLGLREACFAFGSVHNAFGDCPGGATATSGPGSATPCVVAGCEHGTHVAGIAVGNGTPYGGALPQRAAPRASLDPLPGVSASSFPDPRGSVPPPCTFAYQDDVLAALDLLVVEAAHYHFAAINMSLGFSQFAGPCPSANSSITTAIGQLHDMGVAVVAATGNAFFTNAISL